MKNLIITILTILILSLVIVAQDNPNADFVTMQTEKGLFFLSRMEPQAFSFLVPGNNPKSSQVDGSLALKTDSHSYYFDLTKIKDFLGDKKVTDELEILKLHRQWQISRREIAWKTKLEVIEGETLIHVFDLQLNQLPKKLISTLYWSYPLPENINQASEYYQTLLMGDVVINFHVVFPTTVKTEQVKESLKEILDTFTLMPPQRGTVKPKAKPKTSKKKRK